MFGSSSSNNTLLEPLAHLPSHFLLSVAHTSVVFTLFLWNGRQCLGSKQFTPHQQWSRRPVRLGRLFQDLVQESNFLLYEVIEILLDVLNVFTAHTATTTHLSAISDCKSLLRPSIPI